MNNSKGYYLYISDSVAGAGTNDVVMQLVVVTSIASINFTAGDLTITG